MPANRDRFVYREFGDSQPDSQSDDEAASEFLPPQQQNLRVQVWRKGRGGKTVTVVTGFQERPETLATLLKQLKAQCGAGGTLKESELEIQGDRAPQILQFLMKLGYKVKISGG